MKRHSSGGRSCPDVVISQLLQTPRSPLPHATADCFFDLVALDTTLEGGRAAACSITAVVSPTKSQVVSPPSTKLETNTN